MTKFISIGSCLTGMQGVILNDELGWERLNNAYAGRSDYFVEHFIERSKSLPEPEILLRDLQWKPGTEEAGMRLLDECYRDRVGQIDMDAGAPTLFENLANTEVDVILLDNLHDTYTVLAHHLGPSKEILHSLPMSFSRIQNEADIFGIRFDYSSPIDPELSVTSWIKIINHLMELQPKTHIYFFCAHAVEGVHSEERVARADDFARRFKAASVDLPIQVFPPMAPSDDEMADGDHYSFRLYRAMTGLLQTYELGGWHPNTGSGGKRRQVVVSSEKAQIANEPELAERLKVVCDEEALEKNRKVKSPYSSLPETNFWRKSVVRINPDLVDPVISPRFTISHDDKIATAGSCFAQHISKTLQSAGYDYLVPEAAPLTPGASDENFKVYPARFGNIYTVRQLLQLICRAYALPDEDRGIWVRADGRFIDAFRPQIQAQGFAGREELLADRKAHLGAVREMFEGATIFVFTLGLTEGWVSDECGDVYPLPPGAVGVEMPEGACRFVNFTTEEMIADFREFVTRLRAINPEVKLILTVSPVPLIATYEPKHVLVSNTYSKASLRVVAEMITRETDNTEYFPSFEIITAIHNKSRYYEDDLREVKPEGVANVMNVFRRHYLVGRESFITF